MKTDVYTEITNKIIDALETGTAPWHRSWSTGQATFQGAPLRHNGEPYKGINTLSLWIDAQAKGFASPYWLTYRQAQSYKANVRKGEKSSLSVFAKPMTMKTGDFDSNGNAIIKSWFLMRGYHVFNADQCDGLPERFSLPPVEPFKNEDERDSNADAYFQAIGATISHGGNRAFFRPATDEVQMPEFKHFESSDAYYAVLAHELTHWTGHKDRLARKFGSGFGNKDYAFEELVAELGAAFTCSKLQLSDEPREDHASYIKSWLRALKDDKKYIFQAASLAQKASEYQDSLQSEGETKAA